MLFEIIAYVDKTVVSGGASAESKLVADSKNPGLEDFQHLLPDKTLPQNGGEKYYCVTSLKIDVSLAGNNNEAEDEAVVAQVLSAARRIVAATFHKLRSSVEQKEIPASSILYVFALTKDQDKKKQKGKEKLVSTDSTEWQKLTSELSKIPSFNDKYKLNSLTLEESLLLPANAALCCMLGTSADSQNCVSTLVYDKEPSVLPGRREKIARDLKGSVENPVVRIFKATVRDGETVIIKDLPGSKLSSQTTDKDIMEKLSGEWHTRRASLASIPEATPESTPKGTPTKDELNVALRGGSPFTGDHGEAKPGENGLGNDLGASASSSKRSSFYSGGSSRTSLTSLVGLPELEAAAEIVAEDQLKRLENRIERALSGAVQSANQSSESTSDSDSEAEGQLTPRQNKSGLNLTVNASAQDLPTPKQSPRGFSSSSGGHS